MFTAVVVDEPSAPRTDAGGGVASDDVQGRPTVLTFPGMSRQRPDFTLTSVGVVPWDHCWLAAPVQGATTTGVYWAVAPPAVSRHWPSNCTVPFPGTAAS